MSEQPLIWNDPRFFQTAESVVEYFKEVREQLIAEINSQFDGNDCAIFTAVVSGREEEVRRLLGQCMREHQQDDESVTIQIQRRTTGGREFLQRLSLYNLAKNLGYERIAMLTYNICGS